MFSETLQSPSGEGETMVSFQLAYYSPELQCGLCTSLAHGPEILGFSKCW